MKKVEYETEKERSSANTIKNFSPHPIYSSHIFFGTSTTQKRLLTNQLYVRLTFGRQQVSVHVIHHNIA